MSTKVLNIVKGLDLGPMIVTSLASLATNMVKDKQLEEKIQKEVAKQVAAALAEKGL